MKLTTYAISELIDEISMGPFGSNIKVDCFVDDGIPVLNGSNLTGYKLNDDSFRYVTKEKADSLKKANAYRGDVVITHRGTLGQIVYIPQDSQYTRYVISQSQFRVRCNEKILPEYLVFYFHTRVGQHKLLANASQVGVPALARASTTFKQISIDIPSVPVQKKIVTVVNSLQNKSELNNKINDNLEQQMLSVLIEEKRLSAWKTGTFDQVLSFYDNLRKPLSSKQRENMKKIFPYYGATTIVDHVEDYIFDGLYILISEDGANVVDKNGYPLIQYTYGKFWVNNHAHIVKGKNSCSEALIYAIVKTTNLQSIVTGAAQPKINQANLRKFQINIPNEVEIKKLNSILTPMLNEIISNDIQNQKLAQLRNTLLPKLMSGEIDVSQVEI